MGTEPSKSKTPEPASDVSHMLAQLQPNNNYDPAQPSEQPYVEAQLQQFNEAVDKDSQRTVVEVRNKIKRLKADYHQ